MASIANIVWVFLVPLSNGVMPLASERSCRNSGRIEISSEKRWVHPTVQLASVVSKFDLCPRPSKIKYHASVIVTMVPFSLNLCDQGDVELLRVIKVPFKLAVVDTGYQRDALDSLPA